MKWRNTNKTLRNLFPFEMNRTDMTIAWIINATQYNNSNPTTSGNLLHSQSDSTATSHTPLDIFRLTLSSVIFLLTLLGNTAAIIYIYRHKQLRSIKNYYYGYYLINLNIADLLVAIFCIPFTVVYYESKRWTFGSLFCKVMPTVQVMVVSASICTLATITWERYRAIIHPMTPRSTMFCLRIKILLIWAWALIVAAPSFYAYKYDKTLPLYQCQEVWPTHHQRQAYTIFLFLTNYALPLGFIITAYIIIVVRLKFGLTPYSERASKLLQNQFIKLMALLISSFAICYFPVYVCFFILDFGTVENMALFSKVINFSHVLIWMNSCLNPFFYCAIHGYLRKSQNTTDIPCRVIPGTPEIPQRDSFRRLLDREGEGAFRHEKLSTSSDPPEESFL